MGICKGIPLKAERTPRILSLTLNVLVFKRLTCLGTFKTTFGDLVPSLDTCAMLCLLSTMLQRVVHCYWSTIMRLRKNSRKAPPKGQSRAGSVRGIHNGKWTWSIEEMVQSAKCLPCKHEDLSSIPGISFGIILSCALTSWLEVFSKPTCMCLSRKEASNEDRTQLTLGTWDMTDASPAIEAVTGILREMQCSERWGDDKKV